MLSDLPAAAFENTNLCFGWLNIYLLKMPVAQPAVTQQQNAAIHSPQKPETLLSVHLGHNMPSDRCNPIFTCFCQALLQLADCEQKQRWEGGDSWEAFQMKPSASWKDFREEELFYLLLVNVPGKAALLQHSKTEVKETELPNPLAFLMCQLHFPTAVPKAFAGTWCRAPHKKPQGLAQILWLM